VATFRPSARVKFAARVDEYADTLALRSRLRTSLSAEEQKLAGKAGATQTELQQELADVQRRLTELTAQRKDIPRTQYQAQRSQLERQRDALQRKVQGFGTADTSPAYLDGAPSDDRTIVFEMLPQSVSIERNGINEADTCEITMDYISAPVDPRIIRQCAVEVVVGNVTDEEWEAGMRGVNRSDDGSDFLFSIVGRDEGSDVLNARTSFVGFVDEWSVKWDGEDGDTLRLMCRDMTSLLIDRRLPSGLSINLALPLVTGVQSFIDVLPGLNGLPVQFGLPGETQQKGPIPANAVGKLQKPRRGKKSRRSKQGDQKMTCWDHILDVCRSVGFIPVFYGKTLHIVNPRTFYSDQTVPRRVVWGRNLKDLSCSRKLRPISVKTVEVNCYDPQIGRTRWARYPVVANKPAVGIYGLSNPPQPTRSNDPGVSGSDTNDEIEVFSVRGIVDPEQLKFTAFSVYNQLGRQEIEGNFTTCDIDSVDVSDGTGDLLNLNSGDAVEILMTTNKPIDAGGGTSAKTSLQEIYAMARRERADYFRSLGWPSKTAEQISALQDTVGFQTVFRVQNAQIQWDAEDGLEIKCDFINFITVRDGDVAFSPIKKEQKPSERVDALVRGRQSEEARRAVDASSARRELTELRDQGEISDAEYERRMEVAQENERQSIKNFRRQ
jgi:hypothetical protein